MAPAGGGENLDDTHLGRFAGRCARRVQAWAAAHGVPLVRCESGERKHELVEATYLPGDPAFKGVFCVMVGCAPAPIPRSRHW